MHSILYFKTRETFSDVSLFFRRLQQHVAEVFLVIAFKMANLSNWVSDQLHDVLGFSDKNTTEFLISLAKNASDSQALVRKISEGFDVNERVIDFAANLWSKVPHKQQTENPYRVRERVLNIEQQQKFMNYALVSDDEDDDDQYEAKGRSSKKEKKRKHLRKVSQFMYLFVC